MHQYDLASDGSFEDDFDLDSLLDGALDALNEQPMPPSEKSADALIDIHAPISDGPTSRSKPTSMRVDTSAVYSLFNEKSAAIDSMHAMVGAAQQAMRAVLALDPDGCGGSHAGTKGQAYGVRISMDVLSHRPMTPNNLFTAPAVAMPGGVGGLESGESHTHKEGEVHCDSCQKHYDGRANKQCPHCAKK